MKNKILFIILISSALIFQNTFAQSITASLGSGTFVEGISPVNNNFVFTDPNSTATQVDFYAIDGSGGTVNSFTDNAPSGNTFTWNGVDMGTLNPNSMIWIYVTDANGDWADSLLLTIITKPSWITNGGSANNVTVSGNTIDLDAELPILSSSPNPMPNDVPGLSSRPYDLLNSNVKIHIQYDYTQAASASTLSNPSANFDLNVFNQITIPYTYPLTTITGLTLDDNFNLAIQINGTYNSPEFKIKFPAFRFPVGPIPIAIKIDGGVKFNASITGQLVFGFDNGTSSWGFIDIAGEKTKVTAKINGEGTLRVSADALVASVGGSIIARGSIGGGFDYVSVPTQQVNPLFGINLEIAGALDYKLGIGWLSKKGRIEKTFYSDTMGDQLKMPYGATLIYDHVDAMAGYTATIQKNAAFEVQDYFSQPAFSANNNKLYTIWLDYDNGKQKILFAELDYNSGVFSQPLDVITNKDVISNPKVAILPSGAALITWTESRYNTSNFDSTTQDLSNILKAQDVWATIYDNTNSSFLTPFQLSDDTSTLESGRSDGNANVIMGKGDYGLITWTGADIDNNSSDIYYCTLEETGQTWNFGNSQLLANLPGTNRNVNVAYFDSLTAIASWINDPDGTDSTFNSIVVFQIWDGTTWTATDTLIANDGMSNFDELSMDFNDVYGTIAYTSTHYDIDGAFEKRITANSWDDVNDAWGAPYIDYDTAYYFSKPRVAVNNSGYTALIYQAIQLYADTLNPDEGVLYMMLNDAQNANTWVENTDTSTLGDPNVYVADIVTSFDNGSNLFVITQEADEVTGQAPINPVNGVRFGNNYLNLVLRAFTVSSGLTVNGTTEPNTSGTITKADSYENKFNITEAYPNPFTNYTNIKYSLTQKSKIKIEVFDFMGRPVITLFEGTLNEGIYSTTFEPKNLTGGIYFCRIAINNTAVIKKIILIK